jgi:hypothetical protein
MPHSCCPNQFVQHMGYDLMSFASARVAETDLHKPTAIIPVTYHGWPRIDQLRWLYKSVWQAYFLLRTSNTKGAQLLLERYVQWNAQHPLV